LVRCESRDEGGEARGRAGRRDGPWDPRGIPREMPLQGMCRQHDSTCI
jgi:hypothetical protein